MTIPPEMSVEERALRIRMLELQILALEAALAAPRGKRLGGLTLCAER